MTSAPQPNSRAEAFPEHRERLLALARRNLNPILARRVSAEDAVQDTLAAACAQIGFFENRPEVPLYCKLRLLLFQTISALERKHLQCQKRDAYKEVDNHSAAGFDWNNFADSVTGPLTLAARADRHELLRTALATMPENDRQILELRHLRDVQFGVRRSAANRPQGREHPLCPRAGTAPGATDRNDRVPPMNEAPSFEELVEQFLDRCRLGDAPGIDSFAELHPEHAARLRELLPFLLQMEGCAAPETPPDFSGTDYRLLRRIGAGGMGVVFEALQISLNRKVAVKVLAAPLVADAAQREAFENEARVIAMLHHPHIVKVLSAGCGPERCYYAMELIEGRGVDQCRLHDLREVARIGLQAARALAYAHSCGVMHRDVKPANLLFDAAREVHVGDFGLAFVLRGADEMVEEAGGRSGTLRYMAPERLAGGVNTFAGDQYALGATLYELAANDPMLPEKNPKELIKRICREPVPPLRCAEPDLAAIINKCVAFQPANRYRSMEDLAEDLRRFLHHEPVEAAQPPPPRRFRLWAKRKPAVAALSVLSAFCALACVAALAAGYLRTAAALTLAEKNAATANATLSRIFAHIETQTPTASASALPAALMPYYQEIAEQRNLPADQVAEAMRRQGKTREAGAISRRVVEQYSGSSRRADRCEAVRALLALAGDPESREWRQAFDMVKDLLQADPANPEYRFFIRGHSRRQSAAFPERTDFRRDGEMTEARKETERLLGMLEILAHNPETPDDARECLARMRQER